MATKMTIEEARQQFALHEQGAIEARSKISQIQREMRAHEQIAEGLALLFPQLKAEVERKERDARSRARAVAIEVTEAAGRHNGAGESSAPRLPPPVGESAPPNGVRTAEMEVPKGLSALRLILRKFHRDEFLTSASIHKEMVDRGWTDDSDNAAAAVRASLNRAVKTGSVVKRQANGREMEYAWGTPQTAAACA